MSNIEELFRSTGGGEPQRLNADEIEARLEEPAESDSDVEENTAEAEEESNDAAADELEETAATLESLKVTLEHLQEHGGGTPAMHQMINQQLARVMQVTDTRMPKVSLESIDGQYDYTASLEAVSGVLDRLIQGWVVWFKGGFDVPGAIFLGRARKANQFLTKIDAYRKEWKEKRKNLSRSEVIGSYANTPTMPAAPLITGAMNAANIIGLSNMAMAFMRNNQVQFDPLKITTEDLKAAKFILVDYPKKISEYAAKVDSIVKGAKLDDDASFFDSVVKKLMSLDHPAELFDSKLVGAGPTLLGNWGLQYKTNTQPPVISATREHNHLSALAQKRLIKSELFNLHRAKGAVLHDVVISVNDVEKVFDNAEQYMTLVVEYYRHLDVYTKNFKSLANNVSRLKVADAGLGAEGKAGLRQFCTFLTNLVKASRQPVKAEVWRCVAEGIYVTYFGARLIANAR